MEKFMMASGTPIRYADYGKGERVVLLLHGYLESMEVWGNFGGMLGKEFRVVMLDLPGHGFSLYGDRSEIDVDYMATVVGEMLAKLGVSKVTVVGHSMGGYVVVALAELYGSLVERVALFHSSPYGDTDEKRAFREREIQAILAGKKELLSTVNPGRGFAPQNVRRCHEAIDELAEQIMMTDDAAIVAVLRGLMRREDRSVFFGKMTIPSLLVFGMHDSYIPVEVAKKMEADYPNSRVAWLEASGHCGFIEEPEKTLEILRDFMG